MPPHLPQISVVLPVYQGMPYLREAVESVLGQTLASFEFIIGDDGSTDASRSYLESLRDPRVRFFPSKSRHGLFVGLNRLISRCRSPLIQFLCQDDRLERNALAEQVALFQKHPEIALVLAKYSTINEAGAVVSQGALGDLPEVLPSALAMQHFFYHGCIAGNLSTVAIRSVAIAQGAFDPKYKVSADYELWARTAARFPIGINHQRLLQIRAHSEQLSRANHSVVPFVMENAAIRKQILPYLPRGSQAAAKKFERRRHHVLDFHQALRCFLSGRWSDGKTILQAMGRAETLKAAAFWALTLNNHLRPQAPWVLPESQGS